MDSTDVHLNSVLKELILFFPPFGVGLKQIYFFLTALIG